MTRYDTMMACRYTTIVKRYRLLESRRDGLQCYKLMNDKVSQREIKNHRDCLLYPEDSQMTLVLVTGGG